MKRYIVLSLSFLLLMVSGNQGLKIRPITRTKAAPVVSESCEDETEMKSITITIGDKDFNITLYDNETAAALLERLPMTLDMSELNGNEKYYYLPEKLPSDAQKVENIKTGDLMLYGTDCLVLFYKGFSTPYSYTQLGYMEDSTGLAAALGKKNIQVTFLSTTSSAND